MKEKIERSYRADRTADGLWTVYRVTNTYTGPWYSRKHKKSSLRLGTAMGRQGVDGLINRDVIQIQPDLVLESNYFHASGRSNVGH